MISKTEAFLPVGSMPFASNFSCTNVMASVRMLVHWWAVFIGNTLGMFNLRLRIIRFPDCMTWLSSQLRKQIKSYFSTSLNQININLPLNRKNRNKNETEILSEVKENRTYHFFVLVFIFLVSYLLSFFSRIGQICSWINSFSFAPQMWSSCYYFWQWSLHPFFNELESPHKVHRVHTVHLTQALLWDFNFSRLQQSRCWKTINMLCTSHRLLQKQQVCVLLVCLLKEVTPHKEPTENILL